MDKILKSLSTLGFVGYLPAPGTMGTVASLPLVYCLSFLSMPWQTGILSIAFVLSYFVIDGALKHFHESDPSQIVLDEVIGCLITFYCIQYSYVAFLMGFVLFRLFDIFKPFGIKRFEALPGAVGILLDDCVAGIFAHVILRFLLLCLSHYNLMF